jgi:dTDP-glucose pyrophosphorylase
MKDLTVKKDIVIRQAMIMLNDTAEKCLLVVDDNKKLLGSLTDGDLRRAILKGKEFSDSIFECYYKTPKTLTEGHFIQEDAKQLLLNEKLDLIPVIDEGQKVVSYITWANIDAVEKSKKKNLDVPVVIMAGGKGNRMEPFTKVLPKPLIPVNDKTIIEHIIERFTDIGCLEVYLTVNYKSKIIKAYFGDLQTKYNVTFVDEKTPLGTAGSLQYLKDKFDKPFFVTNCDVIIKADYAALYEFHQKGEYEITLVASDKDYIIPYGTCELNSDGNLSHINEKPKYNLLVNTGLYVINPEVLKLIKTNKFYHITNLIEDVKNNGKKVGVFPVDADSWFDVGQWAEYRQTVKML